MSKNLCKCMHVPCFRNFTFLFHWLLNPWMKFLLYGIRKHITIFQLKLLSWKNHWEIVFASLQKVAWQDHHISEQFWISSGKESKLFQEIRSPSVFHHDNSWGLLSLSISFLQLFIHTLHQTLTPLVLFNILYSLYHASQRKTNQIRKLLFWHIRNYILKKEKALVSYN